MSQDDPFYVFGQRIRKFRMEAGLSQEALAEIAELDRTYVSGIERGKRNVSLKNIYKLATALKIPPYKLLQNDDENSN